MKRLEAQSFSPSPALFAFDDETRSASPRMPLTPSIAAARDKRHAARRADPLRVAVKEECIRGALAQAAAAQAAGTLVKRSPDGTSRALRVANTNALPASSGG